MNLNPINVRFCDRALRTKRLIIVAPLVSMLFLVLFLGLFLVPNLANATMSQAQARVFLNEKFTKDDAVLVISESGETLFSWQADKLFVPASLTKLVTAQLAINKWGLEHRFLTDFYLHDDELWVKGYGDPFLVSEELDAVVLALKAAGVKDALSVINIDNSYFDIAKVPGRSAVSDPYNAPLSAVAANFNTAKLRLDNGVLTSAEKQTPLTPTAKKMAASLRDKTNSGKTERVNLVNPDNAQRNFAELLLAKFSPAEQPQFDLSKSNARVKINQQLPAQARLLYRHKNTKTLAEVLRGTLEFSNNFIANQVFLKLTDQTDAASVAAKPKPVSFPAARKFVSKMLANQYQWSNYTMVEGAGLSRENRLSALQIDDVLRSITPHKNLLKKVKSDVAAGAKGRADVFAKTGTLDGVRAYAGYISLSYKRTAQESASKENVRFVFMFNRAVPWRYREQLLDRLIQQLPLP